MPNKRHWLIHDATPVNITNTTDFYEPPFPFIGEIFTLMKIGAILIVLCVLICLVKKAEERSKKKSKMARQGSIISDTDGGQCVEMTELNDAAEAAAAVERGEDVDAEAPGAATASATTRAGIDGVRDELTRLRLEQYTRAFEANGYDMWDEVLRLPPHRLAKLVEVVGFSANHGDRFREQISYQRRKRRMGQAGGNMQEGAAEDESCVIL